MNEMRKSLGARLREAREYLDLSQDEVARILGLPRPAISRVESGLRKVEVFELKKLAELYQRPLSYFTGDDVPKAAASEVIQHLARTASDLTESDQAELLRFAEFLSSKPPREED